MTYADLLPVAVAAVSYAVAATVRIELSSGRSVTAAAALGPALVVLGTGGYEFASWWAVVAVGLGAEALILGIQRRSPLQLVGHAGTLSASAGVVFGVSRLVDGSLAGRTAPLIWAVVGSALIFALADLVFAVARRGIWRYGYLKAEAKAAAPIEAVFASTAGLVVLTFGVLGSAAFLVLLLPLLAVRHEFLGFATARRTYEETVRALGRLTERAGYAPEGRHERLAARCEELAAEAGIWGERARKLKLVALMYDVGAVSFPDPDDARTLDQDLVRVHTARILEETGYLADLAPNLSHRLGPHGSPEAEILSAALAHDRPDQR